MLDINPQQLTSIITILSNKGLALTEENIREELRLLKEKDNGRRTKKKS